jgi:very-short-patch-repair endonuclease
VSQSDAELLLSVQLEQAGIPFEREYQFAKRLGRKWRADFVLVTGRVWNIPDLLIEIDGGSWVAGRHTRGTGFEKDAEKLNAAAELGYRTLRFTPRMVESGEALAQIKRILGMEKAA